MTCALCQNPASEIPILEGDQTFCCAGCHAVFRILATKNELHNYFSHPLFQQAVKAGIISNPLLLEQIRLKQPVLEEGDLKKIHLEIFNMWCPACSELIKLVLLQEVGIKNCVVDYSTDLASIEYSPRHIDKEKIYQCIQQLGYLPKDLGQEESQAISKELSLRFIIAAFCSLNIMMFAYPLYSSYFHVDAEHYGQLFSWLSLLAALPVLIYSMWPILKRFYNSLKVGLYGMESLVVIGVSAAFFLSLYELYEGSNRVYYDSMTVTVTFVLLGKIIESKAKFSAKKALTLLSRAMPKRGRKRFPDGSLAFVPIKEILPNDIVETYAGEKFVVDGIVLEGQGTCDESLMTGEALPVIKSKGLKIVGGSYLQSGSISYKVTSLPDDTILHKIIQLAQDDLKHKSAYVRAADLVVIWFVPVILITAISVGLFSFFMGFTDVPKSSLETAFIRAISVLLISCPCAIGIAVPFAEAQVISELARLGLIVRNRGCLKLLGKETIFVFDKTGTITEGNFRVLHGLEQLSQFQKSLLKGLALKSNHLIAMAIANSILEFPERIEKNEEVIGLGMKGYYQGKMLLLGSFKFLNINGIKEKQEDDNSINTIVYFSIDGNVYPIMLGDRIRETANETLAALKLRTVLLSGDSERTVKNIAHQCGFKECHGGYSPLQKKEFIEALRHQGHIVCMVGDGINDAPSLASAHIGISVVSASDISIQVSDMLLTTDRLQVIPQARFLAKRGDKILRQNLFWTFFYNVIGIGLAASGMLSPIFAAFAMMTSSIMVMLNARRIRIRKGEG